MAISLTIIKEETVFVGFKNIKEIFIVFRIRVKQPETGVILVSFKEITSILFWHEHRIFLTMSRRIPRQHFYDHLS
jgi:hypothetical protein